MAIRAIHKIAELPKLRFPGRAAQLSDDSADVRTHAACGTYLLLNLQLAFAIKILHGKAVADVEPAPLDSARRA